MLDLAIPNCYLEQFLSSGFMLLGFMDYIINLKTWIVNILEDFLMPPHDQAAVFLLLF